MSNGGRSILLRKNYTLGTLDDDNNNNNNVMMDDCSFLISSFEG